MKDETLKNKTKTIFTIVLIIDLVLLLVALSFGAYSIYSFIKLSFELSYVGIFISLILTIVLTILEAYKLIILIKNSNEAYLLKNERTIGKIGLHYIVLSVYLIGFSAISLINMISNFESFKLTILIVLFSVSIISFFEGFIMLKMNSIYYRILEEKHEVNI